MIYGVDLTELSYKEEAFNPTSDEYDFEKFENFVYLLQTQCTKEEYNLSVIEKSDYDTRYYLGIEAILPWYIKNYPDYQLLTTEEINSRVWNLLKDNLDDSCYNVADGNIPILCEEYDL